MSKKEGKKTRGISPAKEIWPRKEKGNGKVEGSEEKLKPW
jgi:hypothetical protein